MQHGFLRARYLDFTGDNIAGWIERNGSALSDDELNTGRAIDIFSNLMGFEGLINAVVL